MLNYGVVSGVLYVVGIILLAVTACTEFVNTKAIRRSREEVEADMAELRAGPEETEPNS